MAPKPLPWDESLQQTPTPLSVKDWDRTVVAEWVLQEILEVKEWWEEGQARIEAKDLPSCVNSMRAEHFASGKIIYTCYNSLEKLLELLCNNNSILDLNSCYLLDDQLYYTWYSLGTPFSLRQKELARCPWYIWPAEGLGLVQATRLPHTANTREFSKMEWTRGGAPVRHIVSSLTRDPSNTGNPLVRFIRSLGTSPRAAARWLSLGRSRWEVTDSGMTAVAWKTDSYEQVWFLPNEVLFKAYSHVEFAATLKFNPEVYLCKSFTSATCVFEFICIFGNMLIRRALTKPIAGVTPAVESLEIFRPKLSVFICICCAPSHSPPRTAVVLTWIFTLW